MWAGRRVVAAASARGNSRPDCREFSDSRAVLRAYVDNGAARGGQRGDARLARDSQGVSGMSERVVRRIAMELVLRPRGRVYSGGGTTSGIAGCDCRDLRHPAVILPAITRSDVGDQGTPGGSAACERPSARTLWSMRWRRMVLTYPHGEAFSWRSLADALAATENNPTRGK